MQSTLNHVSLIARDLAQSIRFYEDVFGMERVPTPNFGFPVQWLRTGTQQIHLFERPDTPPIYHHLALSVDDFPTLYRRVKAEGWQDQDTFGHHLYELPGDTVQLYLRDPSGNLVEVDYPHRSTLPDDIADDIQRLEDKNPQNEENRRATLFLT